MKQFIFVFILLNCGYQFVHASSDVENDIGSDYYDMYDYPSEELDLDSDVNLVNRAEMLRQIILNPRKRRERRRRNQAAFNELTSLGYCWEQHDICNSLNTNEIKYGLKNDKYQRFWHCNCDLEFYNCLHHLNSTVSNHIGELYFEHNYRCYRKDYEVQKCRIYDDRGDPAAPKRCVQYLTFINTDQRYQWFDLPFYSGKPLGQPMFAMKKI